MQYNKIFSAKVTFILRPLLRREKTVKKWYQNCVSSLHTACTLASYKTLFFSTSSADILNNSSGTLLEQLLQCFVQQRALVLRVKL